jgi:hypothetical protein
MLGVLYGTSYDDPSLTANALGEHSARFLRFAAAPETAYACPCI